MVPSADRTIINFPCQATLKLAYLTSQFSYEVFLLFSIFF